MRPVVLDFETLFDRKDYSLSRMTTEAYVRDPRFEAHGAAIKWSKNHDAVWYPEKELRRVLADEDWSDVLLICHHAHFDGFILSHHYNVVPALYGCTLSMARLLLGNHLSVSLDNVRKHFGMPGKSTPYGLFEGKHWHELSPATQQMLGDGACDEVESIWKIFGILARDFPGEEYGVIDSTIRMFTQPELIGDSAVFAKVWEHEAVRKQQMLEKLGVSAQQLGSDETFASLLRARGVEPDTKTTDKGNVKFAFAKTDPFMEELQQNEDDEIRALAEARLGTKSTLLQTRSETLGWMASRGPLCVYLRYAGAHTSRWSGGDDTNFQNWTNGNEINTAIVAPDGWLIGEPDASQIECVAHDQIVLTDHGPKAIQNVELADRVWDGIEWVVHEGVILKGTREVITYQGLTCTPDHVVYVRGHRGEEKMEMRFAAASSRDLVTADTPITVREAPVRKPLMRGLQNLWRAWNQVQLRIGSRIGDLGCRALAAPGLYRRRDRPQKQRWPLPTWKFEALDAAGECQQSVYDFLGANQARSACNARLQASVPAMRLWTRSDQSTCRGRDDGRSDNGALQKGAVEVDGCSRKEEARGVQKARVYDIVNAGPRHRFTVSGVIVSNCRLLNFTAGQWDKVEEFRSGADPYIGVASAFYKKPINKKDHPDERQLGKIVELQAGYGSGGNKIRSTVRVKSQGKIILTPAEGVQARDAYRGTHPEVVKYWGVAETMLGLMASNEMDMPWGPFRVVCRKADGTKRIVLPNGIQLIYDTLNYYSDAETGDRYWRLKTRKGWVKIYGSKLIENMIQALARVVVSQALLRLKKLGYRCKNTKHDSLWLLIPDDGRLPEHKAVILREMSRSPVWMPEVPLGAEFKGEPARRITW